MFNVPQPAGLLVGALIFAGFGGINLVQGLLAAIRVGPSSSIKTMRTVRNCPTKFRIECTRDWDGLKRTRQDGVRHCKRCAQNVYLCVTDEETIAHAKAGHCIAREVPDRNDFPRMALGKPENEPLPTKQQEDAMAWYHRENAIDDAIENADAPRACPECHFPAPTWRASCRVCGFAIGRERSS